MILEHWPVPFNFECQTSSLLTLELKRSLNVVTIISINTETKQKICSAVNKYM